MAQIIKIRSIDHPTHNVLRIMTDKPADFHYHPGQAIDLSINKPEWNEKRNPFTFTSIPEDDFLEFTIKTYPSHNGVTNKLLEAKVGDELIFHKVFGSIDYKGEGVFIAGGAGITPFLSIFKFLDKNNKVGNNRLIFANKTKADVIDEAKLKSMFGDNFAGVLSEEEVPGYEHGYVSESLIKKMGGDLKYYYLCGPRPMMKAMEEHFAALGIDDSRVIKERF